MTVEVIIDSCDPCSSVVEADHHLMYNKVFRFWANFPGPFVPVDLWTIGHAQHHHVSPLVHVDAETAQYGFVKPGIPVTQTNKTLWVLLEEVYVL